MSRRPTIPAQLCGPPFLGSTAIQAGLVTRPMLRGPTWCRLMRDVYVHRDTPLDHHTWCRAASLVLPRGAAIGGPSAAYLWGIDLHKEGISVVVPRDRGIRHDDRIVAHHTVLEKGDLTWVGEIPVTTPERTAFDLSRRLPRAEALVVLDAMLHRHLLRRSTLQVMALERVGWPASPRLRDLLCLADARAESPMETRLRLLLLDGGLPQATAQYEVRDSVGRLLARVDLAWPDRGVIAEYDGDHHRGKAQFRHDVARLNALRMAGWTVLRFTADDVLQRPCRSLAMVSAALSEGSRPGRAAA
jgi:very-short-patch-repair endonuclease